MRSIRPRIFTETRAGLFVLVGHESAAVCAKGLQALCYGSRIAKSCLVTWLLNLQAVLVYAEGRHTHTHMRMDHEIAYSCWQFWSLVPFRRQVSVFTQSCRDAKHTTTNFYRNSAWQHPGLVHDASRCWFKDAAGQTAWIMQHQDRARMSRQDPALRRTPASATWTVSVDSNRVIMLPREPQTRVPSVDLQRGSRANPKPAYRA